STSLAPIEGICISVSGDYYGSARTDAAGAWKIGGLRAGSYKVGFYDCNQPRQYLSMWYDHKFDYSSAEPIQLGPAEQRTGIDETLVVGGKIRGTVTDAATGQPLSNISVRARASSYSSEEYATTGSDGTYSIGGLADGAYTVMFQDWSGGHAGAKRDSVMITNESEAQIDVALTTGGSISGLVTDADTGSPLSNVAVSAHDSSYSLYGWAYTGPDGRYTIRGLAQATYTADFYDNSGQYANQSVGSVVVTEGSDTRVNIGLHRAGSISGRITEASGNPVGGICVSAVNDQQQQVGRGYSDSDGMYTIREVPSGSIKVQFYDCGGVPNPLPTVWYHDKPDFSSADLVQVLASQTTTHIDQVMGCHDSDDDGLTDCTEARIGTNPYNRDSDGDGLTDGEEVNLHHTAPLRADTDADGLNDGAELNTYHTDPLKRDSDDDRLNDGQEVNQYRSDPLKVDTDGDGFGDGFEVLGGDCAGHTFQGGSDPNDASSTPVLSTVALSPGIINPLGAPLLCS
ncbi:MAG: carboxypeptidase regulatory-like domain-containing protein, partial [Actinobacteria bacterium]|nr:carboxypeptidase regulatory-like domain-containing protein [Actinomycetota bacterium]